MQRSYLDYAMSVIVGRALPDVRDGLKPVHRRVLYAMYDGGYRPDRGFSKCSRVVGDVMGQYHPHGDTAIYDTLVRLAQPWSMRYPLVQGQGNFGSPGNDPPAAMRYTECRLAPLAMEMVRDIDEDTVDFRPNYDGRNQEPVVLPAGSRTCWSTARPASRSAWPPTSRRTTCARSPPARSGPWSTPRPTHEELLDAADRADQGPGLPDRRADRRPPRHRGRLPHRPRLDHHARGRRGRGGLQGRTCLVVTELPYQVNPDNLALKIAELADSARSPGSPTCATTPPRAPACGWSSCSSGTRSPRSCSTTSTSTPSCRTTSAPTCWRWSTACRAPCRSTRSSGTGSTHQIEVIVRRTRYRLRKAEERAHILRGLLKALDALDEVIALIRRSATVDEARAGLMELLEIDEIQARRSSTCSCAGWPPWSARRSSTGYDELEARIAEYRTSSPRPSGSADRREELAAIVEKFGDDRRTQLVPSDGDITEET